HHCIQTAVGAIRLVKSDQALVAKGRHDRLVGRHWTQIFDGLFRMSRKTKPAENDKTTERGPRCDFAESEHGESPLGVAQDHPEREGDSRSFVQFPLWPMPQFMRFSSPYQLIGAPSKLNRARYLLASLEEL